MEQVRGDDVGIRTARTVGILGIAVILAGCNTPEPSPSDRSAPQSPTVPVEVEADTQGEVAFEVIGLPPLEDLQVSSNQTDEEIAHGLINIIDQWQISGANKEMYEKRLDGENIYLTRSEYATKVAEAGADVFARALYGDDYSSNVAFAESVEQFTLLNATLLSSNYQTYGDQNRAPYLIELSMESLLGVVQNDDGTVSYNLFLLEKDNTSQNIVEGDTDSARQTSQVLTVDKSGQSAHLTAKPSFQQ